MTCFKKHYIAFYYQVQIWNYRLFQMHHGSIYEEDLVFSTKN